MTLTFNSYEVTDSGITFHFVSPDPGPSKPSDYYIMATDAELGAVTSQAQLLNLVTTKLNRKLRATGIATKLDPFLNQSITI